MNGLDLLVKNIDKLKKTDIFDPVSPETKEYNRITVEYANLIMRSRKAAGLSQKQLAEMIGVSQSAISQFESGDENFSISTLAKIFCALQIRISVTGEKLPDEYEHIAPMNTIRYNSKPPQGAKVVDFKSKYDERMRV